MILVLISVVSTQLSFLRQVPLKTGEQLFAGSIGNRFPDLRDVENRGTSDDSAIVRAVGEEGARFFKQWFELKIKGDLIPEAAVEELIGELQEL